MAEPTLDPVDNTKIGMVKAWAEASLSQLVNLPCETNQHDAWWAEKLSLVQGALKELEDERTTVTQPINKDLKKIHDSYKPASTKLEELKALIKTKRGGYAVALQEAQDAARAAAVLAAQAGDSAGCNEALAAIPEDATTAGTKLIWKWRCVKLQDVPRAYLDLATARLDAVAAATLEKPAEIEGIEFYRDATVRATKGKKK